jgi:hypothetical protein
VAHLVAEGGTARGLIGTAGAAVQSALQHYTDVAIRQGRVGRRNERRFGPETILCRILSDGHPTVVGQAESHFRIPLRRALRGNRLRDGTDILLEPNWSSTAVRSVEERARYDGKRVEVIGVVRSEAPAPAKPTAYVMGPCVTPVEAIRSPPGEFLQ